LGPNRTLLESFIGFVSILIGKIKAIVGFFSPVDFEEGECEKREMQRRESPYFMFV